MGLGVEAPLIDRFRQGGGRNNDGGCTAVGVYRAYRSAERHRATERNAELKVGYYR